jgi:hypothetical protein
MALLQLSEQGTALLPAKKGDIITKPTTKETLVSQTLPLVIKQRRNVFIHFY